MVISKLNTSTEKKENPPEREIYFTINVINLASYFFYLFLISLYKVLSTNEFDLVEMPYKKIIRELKIQKTLSENELGGSLGNPNYFFNPQFYLKIRKKLHIKLFLEGPEKVALMLVVYKSRKGLKNIRRLDIHEILRDNLCPGYYFESFSYFSRTFDAGEYLVMMTSEDGQV